MELGEIGNFPGEGEFIYKRTKFCDGVYRVDMVDKAPLVRCRDCRFYECGDDGWWCLRSISTKSNHPDGFCACGERRKR